MKQKYLLPIIFLLSSIVQAQNPADFIFTYEVNDDSYGLYANIPITGSNFTIDMGDGTILTQDDNIGGIDHTYNSPGTYTVTVSGNFEKFNFDTAGYHSARKLKTVEQWGTTQWTTMEDAFKGCQNLTIVATDIPDLSQVTTMSGMFYGASSFNSPINGWDVSNVTNMNRMFREASSFNQPLNNWDVSNVTNMDEMFGRATSFNQNINDWEVSNVTSMGHMFGCHPGDNSSFNQPLNNWDVSNVTDMFWMFRDAVSFNQPLDSWDVSNVEEFGSMFVNATSFNQDINTWNVSNALSMMQMFKGASSFNQPLNNWNVSNVVDMRGMFQGATTFNQPLNNWNVSNVIYYMGTFEGAVNFNQDLSDWDFHEDSYFGNNPGQFIKHSGLDTQNYDALLLKFAQLGLESKTLVGDGLFYCDSNVRDYLINQLNWMFFSDELDLACHTNTLSGNIIYDVDNNGCSENDVLINNVIVNASKTSVDYSTNSNSGTYSFELLPDTYTLSLQNVPSYFTVYPNGTSTINLAASETVDFCLTASQSIEDLNIVLLPLNEARPGFEAEYQLIVSNVGTETITNVSATLNFDDTRQSFISANPAPFSTTTNSLEFSFANLNPFETRIIDLAMQTFTPPTVNGDDVLVFNASVIPNTNDNSPNNNNYNLAQTVVNSYDPNDKRVLQGTEIYLEETQNYLDYIIRFQNTGTASAINVRILDTLHSNLNWNTIQPISASHDYHIQITDGNKVEYIFDDINLPHEAENEPESHGFIAYKIKLNNDVQIGDIVSGDAEIYFDYNAPIITNNSTTEIVEEMGINGNDLLERNVFLYPNPAEDYMNIKIAGGMQLKEIIIYNLQGLEVQKIQESEENIDLTQLASGMYLVKILTNQGTSVRQLIKK